MHVNKKAVGGSKKKKNIRIGYNIQNKPKYAFLLENDTQGFKVSRERLK